MSGMQSETKLKLNVSISNSKEDNKVKKIQNFTQIAGKDLSTT